MAGAVFFPVNDVERRQIFDIVNLSEEAVWKYIGSLLSNKLNIDGCDQDAIREAIVYGGQYLYHYVMIKLFSAFPGRFRYRQDGPLLYRFVWMEVGPRHVNVLHKGTLWHNSYHKAIVDGLKYILSYTFIDEDSYAQPLLSVESLCQCQLPKCPYSDDVYCIEHCTCTNSHWYTLPRLSAVSAGSSNDSQLCYLGESNYKVRVMRLTLPLKSIAGQLYAFCIPRTDTYFYSTQKNISRAFHEFTLR